MGAAMLLHELGIETDTSFRNNVAYVQNWLHVLKDDPKMVVSAAGRAEKAVRLMFRSEYSSNFLFELWKRVRKYGAFCTGISQNIENLLQSHVARAMLGNSEFLVLLVL